MEEKQRKLAEYAELLETVQVRSGEANDQVLESLGTAPLEESQTAAKVLRRPQVSRSRICSIWFPKATGSASRRLPRR